VINDADENTPRFPVSPSSGYYLPDCMDVNNLPGGLGFPVPVDGMIEGGIPTDGSAPGGCSGDCHFLVVDHANNWVYESYETNFDGRTYFLFEFSYETIFQILNEKNKIKKKR